MSDFRAYMWSVPDWRGDDVYIKLDNREKGIYRELIDQCWIEGRITSDLEQLATMVHEPLDYFVKVWLKIGPKFRVTDGGQSLVSKRLEKDRDRLSRIRNTRTRTAKKAAEARWKTTKTQKSKSAENEPSLSANNNSIDSELHAPRMPEALHEALQNPCSGMRRVQNTEGNTSPLFQDSGNELEKKNSSHMAPDLKTHALDDSEKASPARPARQDPACEVFEQTYAAQNQGRHYTRKTGDFVQLDKLRKRLKVATTESPPGWTLAVENYFGSEDNPERTIADVASRFDIFVKNQLDRYGKAVTNGNGPGTRQTPNLGRGSLPHKHYEPKQ